MSECIFCKIIAGEIPSAKIWENEDFLAILDLCPNTKGMTLVMPKAHYDSYAFNMPDDVYEKLFLAGKKVAKLLDKKLNTKRTAMVMEGMGINHVHLKLYPLHGLEENFKDMEIKKGIFFEKYPGYTTTQLGPQADAEELKKLAEQIKN